MKMATQIDMFNMKDFISEPTTRGCSHDVLVERKWNEDDDNKQIDDSTNSTHAFGSAIGHGSACCSIGTRL